MADADAAGRIAELRNKLLPAKDAAVQAMLARWEAGQADALPLLTSMQQELTGLQQELASLQAARAKQHEEGGGGDGDGQPGGGQPGGGGAITVHLVAGNSSTTIVTTASRLDLARLERQHSVKVMRLAATQDKRPPAQEQYEHAVAQQLDLQAGQHVWLEAEAKGDATLVHRAKSCALFLAKVQAAQLALGLLRSQAEGLALSQGLGALRRHWSSLASWLVGRLVKDQLKVDLPAPPVLREV